MKTAIEFLLLAKLTPQAWELAQKRDKVDFFTQFLSDDTPADELRKIGEYYESRQKISKAGDMYMKAGLYKKAATMYMQVSLEYQCNCTFLALTNISHKHTFFCLNLASVGGVCSRHVLSRARKSKMEQSASNITIESISNKHFQEGFSALEKAIDVVRKSLDRNIASSVLDWVLSESTEGEHQKYIFQLYIALGQYDEAAKTSLEIAKFEQVRCAQMSILISHPMGV